MRHSALLFLFVYTFCVSVVYSANSTPMLKVAYFNKSFGHVHQNPSKYSTSFTTISCGHPLKVLGQKRGDQVVTKFGGTWRYVKVGAYKGYIEDDYISDKKQRCFQDKYPYFFDQLSLKVEDLYYWGRLYDQYERGKTDRP